MSRWKVTRTVYVGSYREQRLSLVAWDLPCVLAGVLLARRALKSDRAETASYRVEDVETGEPAAIVDRAGARVLQIGG